MGEAIEVVLKGRLSGKQRYRVKSLLDMMYTASELAEEIGVHVNQIYEAYIPLGCPHEGEKRKGIMINGREFLAWYQALYEKVKIASDETFCRTCKKAVKIDQPEYNQTPQITYILSICPHCSRRLTKITSSSRKKS